MKFSRDAPKRKVIKALERLGFRVVRVGKHISVELPYEIISGKKIRLARVELDLTQTQLAQRSQ